MWNKHNLKRMKMFYLLAVEADVVIGPHVGHFSGLHDRISVQTISVLHGGTSHFRETRAALALAQSMLVLGGTDPSVNHGAVFLLLVIRIGGDVRLVGKVILEKRTLNGTTHFIKLHSKQIQQK